MLNDLLIALAEARTGKERERIYKDLERVGMDRRTADFLVPEGRRNYHGRQSD